MGAADAAAQPPQGPARYLYVGFAILQCFLGAGIIFGWCVSM